MDLDFKIDAAIKRAADMGFYEHDRRVRAMESMKVQYKEKGTLTVAQENYLKSMLRKFSIEEHSKFIQWKQDWKTDKHVRERGNIISKYYS